MTTPKTVKAPRQWLVGVIASPADLQFAIQMKQPPDLFELRLDCLCNIVDQLDGKMSRLKAPIIITARDPREGGVHYLSFAKRRELLSRFLLHAKYVDVELRSARAFTPFLAQARKRDVRVILSFHDFKATPSLERLSAKERDAKAAHADIFKVATRTDKPSELARLVNFITSKDLQLRVSAMGIGKVGALSRLLLARCGSVLNYGSLQQSQVEGQLPIDVLRSLITAPAMGRRGKLRRRPLRSL
jgi:3-dehydroquinate dehydratase I